jgi:site-specific DNA-cytosine methylase
LNVFVLLCNTLFGAWLSQAFSLDVDMVAASDRKATARAFVCQNHGFRHVFSEMSSHREGSGICSKHSSQFRPQACTLDDAKDRSVDLLVAGIPCHPFTHLRQQNAGSQSRRKGRPEDHPDFNTVYEEFPELLKAMKPLGWVVEETDAFLDIIPDTDNVRYLDRFLAVVTALGYACHALLLDALDWSKWPRSRP